jgi:hypothetical protein
MAQCAIRHISLRTYYREFRDNLVATYP